MTGWTLGGQSIPYPSSFEVEEFDIEYTDRVASGLKVVDVVATKRRYRLTYDYLTLAEMGTFNTIRGRRNFQNFVYKYLGVDVTVSVWMHPMTYAGEFQNPETWTDFTFILEEQ